MNVLFASGLFDSPWVVAIFVIGGAIYNWLLKRRQEKEAEHPPERDVPAPPANKPAGEFSLEEALRRLMGEEPPEPAPAPAPPPIPRAAQGELPPVPAWEEEEPFQSVSQTAPPLQPPPIVVAQASITPTAASAQQKESARRFEQLNEQGRHPATVVGRGRENRSRAGRRTASLWRDPRSARHAFVASIVFAPPKGLEP